MRDAASFLDEAGDVLRLNARQQRDASSAGSSGPFGQSFCTVQPGGQNGVEKSWFDRWLDGEYSDALFDGLTKFLDVVDILEFLKIIKFTSDVVPVLGAIVDAISIPFTVDDLLNDHPYSGNFGYLESYSDYLQLVSAGLGIAGTIMLIPPASPVGAVLVGASLAIGLTGMGIDYGLKAWDRHGRKLWNNALLPAVKNTWNGVRSTVGDVYSSISTTTSDAFRTVDRVKDTAINVATKPFRDAASGLGGFVTKGLSW